MRGGKAPIAFLGLKTIENYELNKINFDPNSYVQFDRNYLKIIMINFMDLGILNSYRIIL